MREAGRIVAVAHQEMRRAVRPGVTTKELDTLVETIIRDHGAIPAFLGYPKPNSPNYPASICASINNQLVHGIPSARVLKEGDIISIDIGTVYRGYVGDSAWTYAVGEIKPQVQRLLDVTEQALYAGIRASVLPHTIRDVALAVQTYVDKHGYSVAREYTGHGVGKVMHEKGLEVPNWWPRRAQERGWTNHHLQVGMTYAIEPMVIAGRAELRELADQWTVVTRDGSLCAHFEHTIAITADEPMILTLP
ncbi:MAG: type I methionyl aminopeptidase [Chloroflexi bacterium]|nr:type I methionyl aminopeptidase [Chloroflexota bacterium]